MKYGFITDDDTGERTRVKIVTIDGETGFVVRFTSACSGCCEGIDGDLSAYPYDSKAQCYIGSGCPECGYRGKRRREQWIPWKFEGAEVETR